MKKIAIVNHGCAKNLIDSELMLGILISRGYQVTLNENESEIVIVNTCSFIHDAEKESVQSVLELIEQGKKIIITGCLPQKYKKELCEAIPEAVAFLGTSDYQKIADVVDSIISKNSENPVYNVCENPDYEYIENIERQQITVGSSSYIKIADGCSFECGYCIIPKLRGKYKSRTIENIVSEANYLAKKGVGEIVLIAQDTTSYGIDLYAKPSLSRLLKELNNIKELNWIRIMYAYPSMIDEELLNTIKSCEKVVKYLDIPLQHVSKNVLKQMKRPVMDYRKLTDKIRKTIPDIALRTTFIVGYPDETEKDFQNLYNFVEEMKFDKLGVFEFSREKGTYAYDLANQVNARTKRQRKNKILKLQKSISKSINESLIGKNISCIVEAVYEDGSVSARTYRDAPEVDGLIFIDSDEILTPGDIVNVEITGALDYDLTGKYRFK